MSDNSPAATSQDEFDITESRYKTSHTAVRKARRFTLQGLYEWLMTDRRFQQSGLARADNASNSNAPHDIAARTRANNAMHTVHLGYYHEMMQNIPAQVDALEALISKHLDRPIDQIDRVEHAVLLIGAYELQHSLHIPYKVVLDEAMKLNTHFGATDAHKLINAVMDRLAAELRPIEVEADTDSGYKQEKLTDKTAKIASDKRQHIQAAAAASASTLADELDHKNDGETATDMNTSDGEYNDSDKADDNSSAIAKPRLSRQRATTVPPSSKDTADAKLEPEETVNAQDTINDATATTPDTVVKSDNMVQPDSLVTVNDAISDNDAADKLNDEAVDKDQNQDLNQDNVEGKD